MNSTALSTIFLYGAGGMECCEWKINFLEYFSLTLFISMQTVTIHFGDEPINAPHSRPPSRPKKNILHGECTFRVPQQTEVTRDVPVTAPDLLTRFWTPSSSFVKTRNENYTKQNGVGSPLSLAYIRIQRHVYIHYPSNILTIPY